MSDKTYIIELADGVFIHYKAHEGCCGEIAVSEAMIHTDSLNLTQLREAADIVDEKGFDDEMSFEIAAREDYLKYHA